MKAVKCPVCVDDGQPIAEKGSPCCEGKGWVLVPEMEQPTYVPYPVPYQTWPHWPQWQAPLIPIEFSTTTNAPFKYTVWHLDSPISNPNVGIGSFQ
jgi:hypothetical protein